jgi:hypothetical protein
MRIMFVYWAFEDQGSGLLINGYTHAAKEMGHEVVVYGRPIPNIPLNYSMDVESADALVYIFEWTTDLQQGDNLDFARLSKIPRRRTVILDGDGNYNDLISVDGDYNHLNEASRDKWIAICDSLSDKICQPTFHPLQRKVCPFLFYSYNPRWELPLSPTSKEFGMVYVGHSKFRWRAMARVLTATEPIRHRLGRIGVVGHGWGAQPAWAAYLKLENAYRTDTEYIRKLRVETLPPIPFQQVIQWMSKARFNPVLSRPTFVRMRIVTPRFFETPAANTFPLFNLDDAYVNEIYGETALELVLPKTNAHEKILDMLERPKHYGGIVHDIRRHLAAHHSQQQRLKELIQIIEN